jgi:transposase InsO family protein
LNTQAQIFLTILAGWMSRKQQNVIEYLLEENRILKEQFDKTGKKLRLTNRHRRELARKGKLLGWKQLIEYANIARPDTIYAWHRKLVALKYTAKRKVKTEKQKRMAVIRELCVKFATENLTWGYGRIQGALANVGYDISTTSAGNILREKGIIPAPERTRRGNWKRFIRSHMSVISVADFFTVEVWTLRGLVRYHVFFVMDLAKRTVKIAHIGCQINGQVMAQVARNLTDYEDGFLRGKRFFICDNDPLYTQQFETILNSADIELINTMPYVPEQNGYAERFVRSIKKECLDFLIFLGARSLRKAVNEYVKHYHHERNHQGLNNLIPMPYSGQNLDEKRSIVKSERLGGLLNYYYRESESENGKEKARAA